MRTYGLIGFPLTHSFSRSYFSDKFKKENLHDCDYLNFPLSDISEFPKLITGNPGLSGLNVTIPYKEKIIPYTDDLDTVAKSVGAVNTIKFSSKRGKKFLQGFNTDVYGFSEALKEIMPVKAENAIIMGTGGASKAVAFALSEMGIHYIFVSRKKGNTSYEELDRSLISEYKLIINTTPLGTYPDVSNCPQIPYEFLTSSHILFDLVYNPNLTLFLRKGAEKGAVITNGLRMLHLQAEKSWEIWNR